MKPSKPVRLELLGVRYLQQAVLLLRDLFLLEGMLSCARPTTLLETHNLMLGVTGSQLERNVPTADYTI